MLEYAKDANKFLIRHDPHNKVDFLARSAHWREPHMTQQDSTKIGENLIAGVASCRRQSIVVGPVIGHSDTSIRYLCLYMIFPEAGDGIERTKVSSWPWNY